jgi:hypothetical protein
MSVVLGWTFVRAVNAMRKMLKLRSDNSNSGSKKCNWGYIASCGVWLSLCLAGVWSQTVEFVSVHLAGIWLQPP